MESYDSTDSQFTKKKKEYRDEFITIENTIDINKFNHLLVMPCGHRNLDTIWRCEKPDDAKLQSYFNDVVLSIEELHNKGRIHGDIKPQNFVRFNNRIKMIDLDASCVVVI